MLSSHSPPNDDYPRTHDYLLNEEVQIHVYPFENSTHFLDSLTWKTNHVFEHCDLTDHFSWQKFLIRAVESWIQLKIQMDILYTGGYWPFFEEKKMSCNMFCLESKFPHAIGLGLVHCLYYLLFKVDNFKHVFIVFFCQLFLYNCSQHTLLEICFLWQAIQYSIAFYFIRKIC